MEKDHSIVDSGLVGAKHLQAVREITSLLEALQHGESVPRVVILRGASGVGKSRIVQEVYGSLVSRQPEPRYWPALSTGSNDASEKNPLSARKVIGPDPDKFHWQSNAEPSFAWWTVACQWLPIDSPAATVSYIERQIQMHLVPLGIAWASRSGAIGQAKRVVIDQWRMRVSEALREGSIEAASKLLGQFGAAVPGLGLAAQYLGESIDAIAKARERRRQIANDIELEAESSVQETGELLQRFTRQDLPAVLAVEDMHLIGKDLAELIVNLSDSNNKSHVLTIGTAWTEQTEDSVFEKLMGDLEAAGVMRIIDVESPEPSETVEIILQQAPATSPEVAEALTTRWRNPYALKLALADRRLRANIKNGAFTLIPENIDRVPTTIKDLYRDRWERLPRQVQAVIAFGAAGGLRSADDGNRSLMKKIIPDSMLRSPIAVELLEGPVDTSKIAEALSDAHNPHSWLTIESSLMSTFVEPDAVFSVLEDLSDGEIESIRDTSANVLRYQLAQRWGEPPNLPADIEQKDIDMARFYIDLRISSRVDDPYLLVATIVLAKSSSNSEEYAKASSYYEQLEHLDPDSTQQLRWRNARARTLILDGQLDIAGDIYRSIVNSVGADKLQKVFTLHDIRPMIWAIMRTSLDPQQEPVVTALHKHKGDTEIRLRVREYGIAEWNESKDNCNIDVPVKAMGADMDFQIGYDNTSGKVANNVTVYSFLGADFRYIAGTATLKNASNPSGDGVRNLNESLLGLQGLNIGNYTPGSNAFVKFGGQSIGLSDKVFAALISTDYGLELSLAKVKLHQRETTHDTSSVRLPRGGYSPERQTYKIKSTFLPIKPTFNSIIDNPNYGDERMFMLIKNIRHDTNGGWNKSFQVELVPNETYLLRLYINNIADDRKGEPAINTRVMVGLPAHSSTSHMISGFIMADNAEQTRISCSIVTYTDQPITLRFVQNSARYYNNALPSGGFPLSDNIVTDKGVQAGYESMDGVIKPGYKYAGVVTLSFRTTASLR